jgi:ATP-binding cassette subfamily B protein
MTGLYLPVIGKVTVSGYDTKDLSQKALYENTTAVFQKYQRYQMTLEDNITISETNIEYNKSTLDNVCEIAGINMDKSTFTEEYETMLSREFGGVDLSGGQWQRIAIARGFFREHNLIVLDESTAAIDPYEETRIYKQFAKISKDKSAIIVTHRLGSAKIADRIVVMKNGEVVEMGTHDELVQAGKEYTRLYKAQEQWYS